MMDLGGCTEDEMVRRTRLSWLALYPSWLIPPPDSYIRDVVRSAS